MQAMADVLVSTDELDELYDAHMTWERWPWGIGWGWRSELNTGVVFWRATNGSLAFVQAWRLAMLAKRETLNTNDQFIFIQMVREAGMERVTGSAAHLNAWRTSLAAHGLLRPDVLRRIAPTTRVASRKTPPAVVSRRCGRASRRVRRVSADVPGSRFAAGGADLAGKRLQLGKGQQHILGQAPVEEQANAVARNHLEVGKVTDLRAGAGGGGNDAVFAVEVDEHPQAVAHLGALILGYIAVGQQNLAIFTTVQVESEPGVLGDFQIIETPDVGHAAAPDCYSGVF